MLLLQLVIKNQKLTMSTYRYTFATESYEFQAFLHGIISFIYDA